ncbi:MAG: P-II family nitrogen regulator [Gammaproteobacteria bacterium]|nr:P-II family nitrogen regulator [Gammaproteobacteria bacterium]
MKFRKITAIIQPDVLEKVEKKLEDLNVPGISVSILKGYGEYKNFYTTDHMVTHVKVEVFSSVARAKELAEAIMEAAHTGVEGDGIVAIIPVETVYHIRTKQECTSEPC